MNFIPFNNQYFIVALIFLIFDLEIVLTILLPISLENYKSLLIVIIFLIALTILLLKELKTNSIEWVS